MTLILLKLYQCISINVVIILVYFIHTWCVAPCQDVDETYCQSLSWACEKDCLYPWFRHECKKTCGRC